MPFIFLAKILAAGIATVSIAGAGVGIGIVFGALIHGVSNNSDEDVVNKMFGYAILGFALTESIALFGLMMSFLLLYGDFASVEDLFPTIDLGN